MFAIDNKFNEVQPGYFKQLFSVNQLNSNSLLSSNSSLLFSKKVNENDLKTQVVKQSSTSTSNNSDSKEPPRPEAVWKRLFSGALAGKFFYINLEKKEKKTKNFFSLSLSSHIHIPYFIYTHT
jgi:hypothetical protein